MEEGTRERVSAGFRAGLDPLRLVVGGTVSIGLIGALVLWAGPGELLSQVRNADPRLVALAGGAAVAGLGLRALAASRLYAATGGPVSGRFFVVYASVVLPRNLLPAGYVTGPPLLAYALARDAGDRFEPTLAPLAMAELLNFVVSLAIASAGALAIYVLGARTSETAWVRVGAVAVGLLAVALVVLWLRGEWATRSLVRARSLARRTLDRLPLTGYAAELLARHPGGRGRAFVGTTRSLVAERNTVGEAFVVSVVAAVVALVPLYLSLLAVGAPAAPAIVLVAVPVSGMADASPLPGGVGGVELALSGLLVTLGEVDPALAAAATLVYRVATLGVLTSVGAVAVGVLAATRPGSPPPDEGAP